MSDQSLREFRVIGPPGTGKTTWLARNVRTAAERYGADRVVVCSLTRAAAAELAGRDTGGLAPQNVGTLHAVAYRALGGVEIAEGKLKSFNEFVAAEHQPWARVGVDRTTDPDDIVENISGGSGDGAGPGDAAMAEMTRLRNRCIERPKWPSRVVAFADLWDRWKHDLCYSDFTDLLEIALCDVATAPGDPAAVFLDESQDFSLLAWRLARKWGERALTFITVGDPDQLLYAWAGVDVAAFSAVDLPAQQRRVLKQSYRVPRAVHDLAVRWIDRTPGRTAVQYLPRDIEGIVRQCEAATWRFPEPAVDDATAVMMQGRTVLFATTCSYMLSPLIRVLRDRGIPFHNPYRVRRGDWNPLRHGAKGLSAADRITAFALPRGRTSGGGTWWTASDLAAFAQWLDASLSLRRGGKTAIDRWAAEDPTRLLSSNELASVLAESAFVPVVIERDLNWLQRSVLQRHRPKLIYPATVADRFGFAALQAEPSVIVSTIHGCKGGEADVCYLFPDLSMSAMEEWESAPGSEGREGIRRTFYVGMTRAREELVLCGAAGPMSVEF